MPRKKTSAPQRLQETERRNQTWNLGENADDAPPESTGEDQGNHAAAQAPDASRSWIDLVNDSDEDYNSEEDADFRPAEESADPSQKKKAKKSKAGDGKPNISPELQLLLDTSKFFVTVSSSKREGEWHATLGELEFKLLDDKDAPAKVENLIKSETVAEFWIYLSRVPEMSFIYFSNDDYFKLKDLPNLKLLEAFAKPMAGRRHNLTLELKVFNAEMATISIDVKVFESTLFKLNHPSDVAAKVPRSAIRAMDFFFGFETSLKMNECTEDDDDNDLDEVEMVRQDIDALYNVIKSYHEANEALDKIDPQHRSLLPELRPYQKDAVKWMVHQEKINQDTPTDEMHPLYQEVTTQDGKTLYYNRHGGFLVKDKPKAFPLPTGGILADEMGLGKTVEVLSCMLCHPRLDVPKPDELEPILLEKETRKRRRRRSPSPTEFQMFDADEEGIKDKLRDVEQFNAINEKSQEATTETLSDSEDEEFIAQVDGGEDSDESGISEIFEENDDYEPESPIAVRENSTRTRGRYKKSVRFESDEEDVPLSVTKQVFSAKNKKAGNGKGTSILKGRKKAKVINTSERLPNFDPSTVLDNRNVNEKSKLADMILYTIIKKSSGGGSANSGVSVNVIKKYLSEVFGKTASPKNNKNINLELVKLSQTGKILNTSGKTGACGSFIINPDFENFDSRAMFVDSLNNMDNVDAIIEDMITEHCYDGHPFVKVKTATELKLEKEKKARDASKAESLYEKLKPMYELQLGYEELDYKRQTKKWHGTFFDTKVEKQNYFECICGADLDPEDDRKYRVQCNGCTQWQHAECVRYDVSNPLRGDYYCPHCWTLQPPVESGATLIVSPSSISYQWIEEILKHIRHKNVRMLFYKGTKASGYIQPRDLANYDIVVTTYSVLQSETNYVDLPHSNSSEGRRFRNPKRFMAIPAPLPCINWWRMVMDEAQMIECTTTKTAEMALRLKAAHRWCVTGTPIGKSLNDLHGLLLFLNVDPYSLDFWWRKCLFEPYMRGQTRDLERVLCQILWRTAKKDVLDQINIPKQTEEIHWLSFSPVEEHFYRRQHIDSSREAVARIKKFKNQEMRLSEMDRNSVNALLLPLLRLRQSCCHPQAVRGQFMSLQKSTMTMEELMVQMIKKVTLEAEEENRKLVAALNGLAGLDLIEEKYEDAAEKYREVLRLVEEYKGKIKTDTLQKLHTVTNLAELLEAGHEKIAPTLRDDTLREEAKDLQNKYLTKYSTAIKAAKDAVTPITEQVEKLRGSFKCADSWYVDIVDGLKSGVDEENILKLVLEEMAKFYDVVNDREFKNIEQKYASSRMVLYKVGKKIEEIDNTRQLVCSEVERLKNSPPEAFLNKAVDCHLRMSSVAQKNKEKCELCIAHDDIELYEGIIFHFVKGEVKALKNKNVRDTLTTEENKKLEDAGVFLIDTQRQGNWTDCEAERLLRAFLKYSKTAPGVYPKSVLEDGQTHMKMFEAMKKEFRLMRILWRQIFDNVAAVDELNMSIMRLRLRFEDEPVASLSSLKRKYDDKDKEKKPNLATRVKDKVETIYILEKHELPSQRLQNVSDKTIASNEFRKKWGQLLYLENLQKSDVTKNNKENPEPCPICQKNLGTQWSVLQCGHCFCIECIRTLIEEYSTGGGHSRSVKCAICRNLTHHAEISYVNTKVDHKTEEDSKAYEAVRGSLSTKMEAVVKTLIKITNDDPEAKSLVFSTWTDVLDILASALMQNDIQFAALHAQGKFKRNLQKFKNREDVKVLLMPISSGANGLNLIEASHVILIEPILNPAQELQAIGRVHRIGQTKPTTIHRFLIKSTIEERMHEMLGSFKTEEAEQGSHSTEENVLTIADLGRLFVDN